MDDGTSVHGPGQSPDEGDLWIDEGSGSSRNRRNRRRAGIVLGVAACVALIGVPVGLLVASGPQTAPQRVAQQHHVTVSGGLAKRSVLAALSATTDAGNFAFSYQLNESPFQSSDSPAPAATARCPTTPVPQGTEEVQGSGTINTNPMAMAASAAISTNGVSGLQVGVRVDPTTVWEVGYADNGLTPAARRRRRESPCRLCGSGRGDAGAEGGCRSP